MSKPERASKRGERRGRGPVARRLAIESLEDRLVLSGNQLDISTWNLDLLGADYAVIPAGDFAAPSAADDIGVRETSTTPSFGSNVATSRPGAPFDSDLLGVSGWSFSAADSHVASSDLVADRPLAKNSVQIDENGYFDSTALDLTSQVATIRDLLSDHGSLRVSWQSIDVKRSDTGIRESLFKDFVAQRTMHLGMSLDASMKADLRGELNIKWPHSEQDLGIGRPSAVAPGFDSDGLGAFESPSPESAATQTYAGGGTSGMGSESEGGSIPVDAIVADVASGQIPLVADNVSQIVDSTPKYDHIPAASTPVVVVGELARAVAFESIDGETTLIVYAAESSGGYAVTGEYVAMSSGDSQVPPADQTGVVAQKSILIGNVTVAAVSAQATSLPASETSVAIGSPTWSLAVAPWTTAEAGNAATDDADAGRAEAFSQFARSDASDERVDRDSRPRIWLAAMPVLAVIAAERVVASMKKRERDASKNALDQSASRASSRVLTW